MKIKELPQKDWIITFEAIDCCGKTSLIRKFNESTDYSYLLRDRSTISVRAYANKFNRGNIKINKSEHHISSYKWHLLVYLTATKEDVQKRQAVKNDGWNSEDYDIDKKLFEEALKNSEYSKVLRLNSSYMSYDEEIQTIINEMLRYENIDNLRKKYRDYFIEEVE